jgi:hypothetical protein
MALFTRTPIDDPALKELVGRRRVLASGRSPEGQVVGLADALLYPQSGRWHELPWHEVGTGGWDHDTSRLRWTSVDGRPSVLPLTEPGRLPDLFNERVTASIACLRTVDVPGKGQALITARRNLADASAPLIWRVSAGKGVQAAGLEAEERVVQELERLRAEYDLA